MNYGIAVVSAPAEEPLHLEEARNHLRLTQTADDHELRSIWIPAARIAVEKYLGEAIVTQTLKVTLDEFPSSVIELPVGPVQSVSSVKYYDANNTLQTLSSAVYQLDATRRPARLAPVYNEVWPTTYARFAAVEITAVVGRGSRVNVSASIKAAMLLTIRGYHDGVAEIGELTTAASRLLDLEWSGLLHGQE